MSRSSEQQAGIVTPQPYAGLLVAFDLLTENREDLAGLFALLTQRAGSRRGEPTTELGTRELEINPRH